MTRPGTARETRREEVARAGRIDNLRHFLRIDDMHLAIGNNDRALFGARERGELAVLAHLLQRLVENIRLVERQDFSFIRKQKIERKRS